MLFSLTILLPACKQVAKIKCTWQSIGADRFNEVVAQIKFFELTQRLQGRSRKCIERIFSESQDTKSSEPPEGVLADVVDARAGQVEDGEPVQVPEDVAFQRLYPVLKWFKVVRVKG